MSPANKDNERRKTKRTDILDTFSLFVSIPQKGPHRLKVHDISEGGMGFDFDIEDEIGTHDVPVESGASLSVYLYLNQSLHIPLAVKVRRVTEGGGVRRVGAEFAEPKSKGYAALLAFLKMLDAVGEAGTIAQ
jgi:c-di-GMP-binding flagellar brake protein YcgR